MKGLIEELWARIMIAAAIISMTIKGTSHHAFLSFKKSHIWDNNDLLGIFCYLEL